MWSLDEVLRYLPMAALHDGHEYLVEKYRITVFTPASVAELTEPSERKSMAGIGYGRIEILRAISGVAGGSGRIAPRDTGGKRSAAGGRLARRSDARRDSSRKRA